MYIGSLHARVGRVAALGRSGGGAAAGQTDVTCISICRHSSAVLSVLSHGLACFIHKNSVLQRYHPLVMIAYEIYATAAPFA